MVALFALLLLLIFAAIGSGIGERTLGLILFCAWFVVGVPLLLLLAKEKNKK